MPASAMRAGLMGFLVLWALYLGRINKMENALALAAVIMLIANPKVLRDDIGFQLSFLALLGLVYVYPLVDRFFAKIKIPRPAKALAFLRVPGSFKIRETAAMTTAAQITTLPVIIYNFSQASPVAVLSNILVLWTLPALMIVFPAVLLAASVIRQIDFVIFLIPDMILRYIIFVAEQSVRLPYAYMKVDLYGNWPIWIVYYAFWIWLVRKR
jgi:competence protein ComEC